MQSCCKTAHHQKVDATAQRKIVFLSGRMGAAIRDKPFFLPFTVLTVATIAWLRWPLPIVMIAGLALSGGVAYWKLGRK